MDSHFTEKTDLSKGTGSGMFEFYNKTNFEKILFLQHQVTELVRVVAKKNSHIQKLEEQLGRAIEYNTESAKVTALKAQITHNNEVIKKYKTLYLESLNKK